METGLFFFLQAVFALIIILGVGKDTTPATSIVDVFILQVLLVAIFLLGVTAKKGHGSPRWSLIILPLVICLNTLLWNVQSVLEKSEETTSYSPVTAAATLIQLGIIFYSGYFFQRVRAEPDRWLTRSSKEYPHLLFFTVLGLGNILALFSEQFILEDKFQVIILLFALCFLFQASRSLKEIRQNLSWSRACPQEARNFEDLIEETLMEEKLYYRRFAGCFLVSFSREFSPDCLVEIEGLNWDELKKVDYDLEISSPPLEIGQEFSSITIHGRRRKGWKRAKARDIRRARDLVDRALADPGRYLSSGFLEWTPLERLDHIRKMGLKKLALCPSSLEKLPEELRQLTHIISLDLSDCNLVELPPWIGELRNLRILKLGSNKLKELPPEIYDLDSLLLLNLKKNRISGLSPKIAKLPNLKLLDISDNQDIIIPPEIAKLGKLESLSLNNTNIHTIPDAIRKLPALRILDLQYNRLEDIDFREGDFPRLRRLDVSHTFMTSFPGGIEHLTNLKKLLMGMNKLRSLPGSIGSLRNLKALFLMENELEFIPKEIGDLTKLRELDLRDNKLSELPWEICKQEKLRILHLENNPLMNPPTWIANRGMYAIREHFEAQGRGLPHSQRAT